MSTQVQHRTSICIDSTYTFIILTRSSTYTESLVHLCLYAPTVLHVRFWRHYSWQWRSSEWWSKRRWPHWSKWWWSHGSHWWWSHGSHWSKWRWWGSHGSRVWSHDIVRWRGRLWDRHNFKHGLLCGFLHNRLGSLDYNWLLLLLLWSLHNNWWLLLWSLHKNWLLWRWLLCNYHWSGLRLSIE